MLNSPDVLIKGTGGGKDITMSKRGITTNQSSPNPDFLTKAQNEYFDPNTGANVKDINSKTKICKDITYVPCQQQTIQPNNNIRTKFTPDPMNANMDLNFLKSENNSKSKWESDKPNNPLDDSVNQPLNENTDDKSQILPKRIDKAIT